MCIYAPIKAIEGAPETAIVSTGTMIQQHISGQGHIQVQRPLGDERQNPPSDAERILNSIPGCTGATRAVKGMQKGKRVAGVSRAVEAPQQIHLMEESRSKTLKATRRK